MTDKNPCQKGSLGEIAVCKELVKLGYEVFVQFGSHSKVDLILLDENYIPVKIQIKSVTSANGIVTIYSNKTCLNPKYNHKYSSSQIDIFAVYILDLDLVFYIPANQLLVNSRLSKFRISEARNGQSKKVRYVEDFLDFKKALRDCTPHTQTVLAVGDETVQTTTLAGGW